jgi:hypothetical protein
MRRSSSHAIKWARWLSTNAASCISQALCGHDVIEIIGGGRHDGKHLVLAMHEAIDVSELALD